MRAWIRILDAPNYYEHTAVPRGQRESPHYKASGLIRTVGPYAQRRVALMPQAIELARDAYALSNEWHEAPRISRGLLSRC